MANVMMEERTTRQPSSASSGFFQSLPVVPPQYSSQSEHAASRHSPADDAVLSNILSLYLPQPIPSEVDKSLHDFARTCLNPATLRLCVDCETNHPTLHPRTTFGDVNQANPLRTSEGWRGLKDIQTQAGVVGFGYGPTSATYNRRIHQFALSHLWSASCASVSCPAAMSDGAAILISRHLSAGSVSHSIGQDNKVRDGVLQEAYNRLISFDPSYAWTSGQWMTERPGGSDVSRTETLAHIASGPELQSDRDRHGGADVDSIGQPLGPYIIRGFKWFSSATDADIAILLAQTSSGLSTFYAPVKRQRINLDGTRTNVMNGVQISRLKNKLGTKGLPTAELELNGMRAWLIGKEGEGVKEISAILNCTRLWTACGSVGGWGRGLAVSRAYAKVRKIKGDELLANNAQHIHWMADETVKYRACAHLAFLGVALLGISEVGKPAVRDTVAANWLPHDQKVATNCLRFLTPVMKAQCSLWATWGLRECMESLGGVGYCENNEDGGILNLARSFRDGNVNPIWEGTTNIIAGDLVRVVKGRTGQECLGAVDAMLQRTLQFVSNDARFSGSQGTVVELVQERWRTMKDRLVQTSAEDLLYQGRQILQEAQEIVCACLLMADAATHSDTSVEEAVMQRWITSRLAPVSELLPKTREQKQNDDQLIFFSGAKHTAENTRARL